LESLFRTAKAILRRGTLSDGQEGASRLWARTLLESAFRLHQSGRLAEALPLYRQAIAIDPTSGVGRNLLGALLCAQGELAEGEAHFRRAIEIDASNVEALNNLASARKDQGDLRGAEEFYRRTLEVRPDFTAAWNNLGLVYVGTGRSDDAEVCFRRALVNDPRAADAHNNLGAVLRARGVLAEAELEFRAAIDGNPALAEAWCGLGGTLQIRGLLDEAETCCRKALQLRPNYPDAVNNLATIAKARGRFDVAKGYCNDVLRTHPQHVGALNNLGSIAARRGDYTAAEAIYRRALRSDSGQAITRYNLSTTLLMLGNYSEGFALYESRFEACPRPFTRSSTLNAKLRSRPRWRGEALVGRRLLVWSEQGLGDCIMMLRYLPQLRARGVNCVTVLCDGTLERLVRAMSVVEQVVNQDQADEALEFDVHCPIMSLPWAFGTHLEEIPAHVPYLNVPQAMIAASRARLTDERPKVGVVWAGSGTLQDDSRRSIELKLFTPLLSLNAVRLVSLQKDEAAEDWRTFSRDGGQYIDACTDFLDTAALIMNLDLLISVDTAVAHLAGALGRPVWLLNRFGSEWRWGVQAEVSTWYPTMRIFRQPSGASWAPVLAIVCDELRSRFAH